MLGACSAAGPEEVAPRPPLPQALTATTAVRANPAKKHLLYATSASSSVVPAGAAVFNDGAYRRACQLSVWTSTPPIAFATVRQRIPADVLLLVTVVFWSFNFTVVKYALTHGWEPLTYSSVRFAIGALLFSGFTYAREGSLVVRRRDVVLMTGAAAAGIWLNQLSFVYAVRLTTAATVALMFGTLPIFVALIAQALGHERLHFRHWLATIISFSGVALVALGASSGLGGDLGGILLGLGASVTWAAYSVAMGPLMRRYSPYRISAFMLLVGSVPLLLSAFEQLARQDWGQLGALAWGAFVYSLFFSLVFTNIMWFTAIDRVGAARASLYANLQPFLGAFFALVVLSEEMGALQVAGGLVIGAGILLARRGEPPAPSVD
jgi:drug/metabolite transporter (DMT)-like permease